MTIREDRPIVFTLSVSERTALHSITTKDPRGSDENVDSIYADEVYKTMLDISEVLNNKGYAVLFEVDWEVNWYDIARIIKDS